MNKPEKLPEYDASLIAYVADGNDLPPGAEPMTVIGKDLLGSMDVLNRSEHRWIDLENAMDISCMEAVIIWKGKGELAERPPQEQKTRWTAREIFNAHFEPQEWLIEEILPKRSVAMLVAREKVGKTWLALQISQAMTTGGQVFGRPTPEGRVLYISCDDPDEAAFKDRLYRHQVWEPTDEFILYTNLIPTGENDFDGLEYLESVVRGEKLDLLILDTFRACFPHADESDQKDVTRITNGLSRLSVQHNCSVLFLHHMNKSYVSDNWLDRVSGSTALSAGVTMIWGLNEDDGRFRFQSKGRRAAPIDVTIEFVIPGFYWKVVGETDVLKQKDGHRIILSTLAEHGPEMMMTDLVEITGRDKGNVSRWANELAKMTPPPVRIENIPNDKYARKKVILLFPEKSNNSNKTVDTQGLTSTIRTNNHQQQ